MTQNEIIRMAREAGFWTEESPRWQKNGKNWVEWIGTDEELERFAALVAEATKAQPQGEPVAWMSRLGNVLTAKYMEKYAVGIEKETHTIPLCTTPPSVEAAIEATKEKAAKVCEERSAMYNRASGEAWEAEQCAAAIRSMK